MTGPEHYAEAGRLLASWTLRDPFGQTNQFNFEASMAAAQVYATVALAAAIAIGTAGPERPSWSDVAGTKQPGDLRIDPRR